MALLFLVAHTSRALSRVAFAFAIAAPRVALASQVTLGRPARAAHGSVGAEAAGAAREGAAGGGAAGVGAAGAVGLTAADGLDAAEVPAELVAFTVKV